MKIIIFGASGTIGRQLVYEALAQGHVVTAFVRNREKLKDIRHDRLHIVTGDVLNENSVTAAIRGHEAVLCALGAGRKGNVRAKGTRNILKGMEQSGVRRFICETTLGCGDSRQNLNFFWKYIMFGWLLKEALLDHELQEKYIRESEVDWTIIRPGAFTKGPATGRFRHGFAANDRTIALKISPPDVAMFMLDQLNHHKYLKKTPGLSY